MANSLYNLSGYAKAYTPAKGEPADGFIISGYRDSEDGENKQYCNIWVPAKTVTGKKKLPDGTIALTIAFNDVEVKVRGEEAKKREENADTKGKTGTPKKKPTTKKKPSEILEELDDDSDIPF